MLAVVFISSSSLAAELRINVVSKGDRPIENVVVTLQHLGTTDSGRPQLTPLEVSIKQIDREFVPAVTIVPVGSAVLFPNQDDILHHVYSFSKAKTFDLPLYKGVPSEPVVFDMPGVAALGCNIHDWMSAHVVIVETPYYQQTDTQGMALLSGLPQGEYELVLWHPRQRKSFSETISVQSELVEKKVLLRLKPSFRSTRKGRKSANDY